MQDVALLVRTHEHESSVSTRALELAAAYGGSPHYYQKMIDEGKIR